MATQETRSFPELQDAQQVDVEAEPFSRGTSFGRYWLLYLLGRGGMGEVYAAWDPELDRKVAVKILHLPSSLDAANPHQVEARALARLSHPNIVAVYDLGVCQDRPFIAMELVDGPTLSDWLHANQDQDWRRIVDVFLQAGRGLAAAHEAGLVHRDFKPSNVIVAADRACLTDFGLARSGGEVPGEPLDRLAGTPGYLAPERYEDSSSTDARSDQFSFCVALYRALFGCVPFPAENTEQYLDRVRRKDVADPKTERRIPGWLRQALRRGLEPDPAARFPSMLELLAALDPAPRRRRLRLAAAGVGAVLVGTALLYGYLRDPRADLCPPATERLQGIWSPERAADIGSAFAEASPLLGPRTFERVAATLDARAHDWLAMQQQTCEATHLRGEQSPRMLDLRMTCLDSLLDEMGAVTHTLVAADEDVVLKSAELVGGLRPLDDCAETDELALTTPAPEPGENRRAVERIRARIERHKIQMELDRPVDLQAVENDLESLGALDYPPLESSALFLLGSLKLYQEKDRDAAVDLFERSLSAAIAGGDRRQQVRVYAHLAQTYGLYFSDVERARWWADFAESALTAIGSRQIELEATLQWALGMSAWSNGEHGAARERFSRLVELCEERLAGAEPGRRNVESLELSKALNMLGIVMTEEGKESPEKAAEILERALELAQEVMTPDHPTIGQSMVNLAGLYAEEGYYAKAVPLAEQALELTRRGPTPEKQAFPLALLAGLHTAIDRPVPAAAGLDLAEPLFVDIFGPDHPFLTHLWETRAEAHFLRGNLQAASSIARQVRTLRDEALPEEHPDRLRIILRQAWISCAQGRVDEARGHVATARDLVQREVRLYDRDRLILDVTEARLELAAGEVAGARRLMDGLLDELDPHRIESDRVLVAEARFVLAQSLESTEADRAETLARAALVATAEGSPWTLSLHRSVGDWLDSGARRPVINGGAASEGIRGTR